MAAYDGSRRAANTACCPSSAAPPTGIAGGNDMPWTMGDEIGGEGEGGGARSGNGVTEGDGYDPVLTTWARAMAWLRASTGVGSCAVRVEMGALSAAIIAVTAAASVVVTIMLTTIEPPPMSVRAMSSTATLRNMAKDDLNTAWAVVSNASTEEAIVSDDCTL